MQHTDTQSQVLYILLYAIHSGYKDKGIQNGAEDNAELRIDCAELSSIELCNYMLVL